MIYIDPRELEESKLSLMSLELCKESYLPRKSDQALLRSQKHPIHQECLGPTEWSHPEIWSLVL